MANNAIKFALVFFLGSVLLLVIFRNTLLDTSSWNEIPTAIGINGFKSYIAKQQYRGRSYECRKSGCTVKLRDESRDSSRNETTRSCSFQLLDDYFKRKHQFHGNGTWYAPTPNDPGLEIMYQPTICSFASVSREKGGLRKCIQKKKLKKIVVTGDSNGRHFKDGVLEVLVGGANVTCEVTRSMLYEVNGTIEKNDSYFDVPSVQKEKLTLPGAMFSRLNWAPMLYECKGHKNEQSGAKLQVEYIHSGAVIDTHMSLSPSNSGTDFEDRVQRADSVLEYLLKYYYPYRGFPDVWFYTPPFHIAINSFSLPAIELRINMMLKLFSLYLPDTTQLIFLSDATHCLDKSIQEMAGSFGEYWNVTMDERIHQMNQLLFSELVSEVTRRSNYHVFLDATRVACPITCTWHHDPAHMLPIWYYKMAEYNMDLVCAY